MDWTQRVRNLRQWSQNGERAPHKPLLMLYALGRFQRDAGVPLRYSDIELELAHLLREYGPPRRTNPAYPFHHLVNDGVWEVRTNVGMGSPGTGVRVLRESGAEGRLVPGLRAALAADPGLLGRLAHLLLEEHFPPSLHAEIAADVGLDLEARSAEEIFDIPRPRRRGAEMRERVLVAYEYQCAFCGYDGAIGRAPVGLEAAHVKWWAFQGPDEVSNALCLCSLHHKLFDKGVLGLDPARRITVSREFTGHSPSAQTQVIALAGRPVLGPQPGSAPVAAEHIEWHTSQVFRGEPRAAVAN